MPLRMCEGGRLGTGLNHTSGLSVVLVRRVPACCAVRGRAYKSAVPNRFGSRDQRSYENLMI